MQKPLCLAQYFKSGAITLIADTRHDVTFPLLKTTSAATRDLDQAGHVAMQTRPNMAEAVRPSGAP